MEIAILYGFFGIRREFTVFTKDFIVLEENLRDLHRYFRVLFLKKAFTVRL